MVSESKFTCRHCMGQVLVEVSLAGQRVRCPHCGQVINMPASRAKQKAHEWFYVCNDQEHGPVSTARLKQLAAAGDIQPDDNIWREGMADWQPARSIDGLCAIPSPQVLSQPKVENPSPFDFSAIGRSTGSTHKQRDQNPLEPIKEFWDGLPHGVKVGVCMGAIFLLTIVVCVFLDVGSSKPTFREFEQKVIGKNAEEVIKAIGRPDRIQRDVRSVWIYDSAAIDPVTGHVENAMLGFSGHADRGAWVQSVNFF